MHARRMRIAPEVVRLQVGLETLHARVARGAPHQAMHLPCRVRGQQVRQDERAQEAGGAGEEHRVPRHGLGLRLERRALLVACHNGGVQARLGGKVHGGGLLGGRGGLQRHVIQAEDGGGDVLYGGAAEEDVQRDVHLERLAQLEDEAGGQDGVAADVEEIVGMGEVGPAQHVLPHLQHRLLVRSHGLARHLRADALAGEESVWEGQGILVNLAVGRQRHAAQRHKHGRDAVGRQLLPQPLPDVCEVPHPLLHRHKVGNERLLFVGVTPHQRDVFAHVRVLRQERVDLTKLNAEAADLDLVVCTADALHRAITHVAAKVPSHVHAVQGLLGEGVDNELYGCLVLQAQVARRQVRAAHKDLADLANANHALLLVKDEQLHVLHAAPCGQDVLPQLHAAVVAHLEERYGALRLGGAVHINHHHVGSEGLQPHHVALGEHVPHKERVAQRGHVGDGVGGQQLPHGGREVRDGDARAGHPCRQLAGVANVLGARDVDGRAQEQRREHVALDGVVRDA
mmetsp:Transcript_20815/g.52699  ORF Transcript_20815/g.52699 Transcript_20815/m.52699 type:complete len:513 (+) Transcript_20815:1960-3498(+)